MNSDFKDLLRLLSEEEVEYLIVGGYAVIYHSQPRFTKDLDLWLRPSKENAARVMRTFQRFGLPLLGDVTSSDFASEGLQYAIGRPPSMIDFLTSIPGLDFETCWKNRAIAEDSSISLLFLSKSDLIQAKKTAGRPQDLADIEELNRIDS